MSPILLRPRSSRRTSRRVSRFRARSRVREEFIAKVVQGVVALLLYIAMIWLLYTTVQLLRVRLLAEFGGRAWLLPIGIGVLFLFLLFRLRHIWREARELWRELRNWPESTVDEEDS
ncbi:MAG: hypothetical protein JW819_05350 [Candidatus Krumholzibacteriota bacterium]|nr:hypothetical protein [Candidatus Krumholzibacteriota bacterium]